MPHHPSYYWFKAVYGLIIGMLLSPLLRSLMTPYLRSFKRWVAYDDAPNFVYHTIQGCVIYGDDPHSVPPFFKAMYGL